MRIRIQLFAIKQIRIRIQLFASMRKPDLAPQQSDGNLQLIVYSTDQFGAYMPTLCASMAFNDSVLNL
jgi:hypothetical protein